MNIETNLSLIFLMYLRMFYSSWKKKRNNGAYLRKTILYILTFITCHYTYGDLSSGKYSGEFLKTGVGARALGMGGAYVAVADDITSIYWNPAGLVSIDTYQLHGMHSERFAGIVKWDFIGFGMPLKTNMAFGIGFFRLGVDAIPFTALRDPERDIGEIFIDEQGRTVINDVYAVQYYNDTEMAFVLSFAKKRSDNFSFGGNIKIIRKSVAQYSAWGLGFDFGILLKPYREMKVGVVLFDGTSTLVAWNTKEKEIIIPHIKAGLAYPFHTSRFRFIPVFDIRIGGEHQGNASQLSWGRMPIELWK